MPAKVKAINKGRRNESVQKLLVSPVGIVVAPSTPALVTITEALAVGV